MPTGRFPFLLIVAAIHLEFGAAAGRYEVFKSEDRGRSWSAASVGLPPQSRVNAFGAVAGTLFAGTLFAGTDAGVFVSTNEARAWKVAHRVGLNVGRILAFATLDDRVYAGTDGNGLWVSADHGRSWAPEGEMRTAKVRCLLVEANRLYLGTDRDGVYVSGAGPSFWVSLRGGLPEPAQVFAMAAVQGKVYAALYHQGLHVWDEDTRRWKKVGTVTPLALAGVRGALIAGHNPGGLHWSSDGGTTWFSGTTGWAGVSLISTPGFGPVGDQFAEAPVWELASDGELAFAGVADGTYSSEDRGRTWTRSEYGLPEGRPGVAFLISRGFVLAGVAGTGPE